MIYLVLLLPIVVACGKPEELKKELNTVLLEGTVSKEHYREKLPTYISLPIESDEVPEKISVALENETGLHK